MSFADVNKQIVNATDSPNTSMSQINAKMKNPPVNTAPSDPISLVKKYFPKDQWDNALAVMQHESGGDPTQVGDNFPINGQTIPSYGLFQIRGLPGRPSPQQLLNPEYNVSYAANMYQQQGWEPWTAARKLGLPGTQPLPSISNSFNDSQSGGIMEAGQ